MSTNAQKIVDNCPVCKTAMQQRSGEFGAFYVCPKGHGTISVQGTKVVATGAIFSTFAKIVQKKRHPLQDIECMTEPNIERSVRLGMATMGMHLSEMDLFIEGGREAAQDEPDHWMNERLY